MARLTQWIIKPAALARAGQRLGLQHPVIVRQMNKLHMLGSYNPDSDPIIHILHIHRRGDFHDYQPSYTIWHELGHALQFERDFKCSISAWDAANKRIYAKFITPDGAPLNNKWDAAYKKLPEELEADEIASQYALTHPVTRFIA